MALPVGSEGAMGLGCRNGAARAGGRWDNVKGKVAAIKVRGCEYCVVRWKIWQCQTDILVRKKKKKRPCFVEVAVQEMVDGRLRQAS